MCDRRVHIARSARRVRRDGFVTAGKLKPYVAFAGENLNVSGATCADHRPRGREDYSGGQRDRGRHVNEAALADEANQNLAGLSRISPMGVRACLGIPAESGHAGSAASNPRLFLQHQNNDRASVAAVTA